MPVSIGATSAGIERNLENLSVGALEQIARGLGADIVDLVAKVGASKGAMPTLRPGRKPGKKR
jgi:hypothetical protein